MRVGRKDRGLLGGRGGLQGRVLDEADKEKSKPVRGRGGRLESPGAVWVMALKSDCPSSLPQLCYFPAT